MSGALRLHASKGHVPLTLVALAMWPCAPPVARDAALFTTSVMGAVFFTDGAQVARLVEYWNASERVLQSLNVATHWLPLLLLAVRRDSEKPSAVHAMAVYGLALAYSFYLPLRVMYQHTSPVNLRAFGSVLFWAWIASAAM